MLSSRLLELHTSPNLSTDGIITKDAKEKDKLYMHPTHYMAIENCQPVNITSRIRNTRKTDGNRNLMC